MSGKFKPSICHRKERDRAIFHFPVSNYITLPCLKLPGNPRGADKLFRGEERRSVGGTAKKAQRTPRDGGGGGGRERGRGGRGKLSIIYKAGPKYTGRVKWLQDRMYSIASKESSKRNG